MSVSNTTIRIKKSPFSGNSPTILADGELAINQADGKLFYRTPVGSISFISNQDTFATIIANGSIILASGTSDTLNINTGKNIDVTACTTTKTITVSTTPDLNVASIIFPDGSIQVTSAAGAAVDAIARAAANSAQSNTIYLFGALNQTNSDIVTANTQLKSYTDGAITSSNTQLKSYVDGEISSANTKLKSYVDGYVESSNTQLKSYTDGVIDSANTQLKSYTDGQISYIQSVNDTQNSNITLVNNLAQNAYDSSNTKFSSSGGTISGNVTISSDLLVTGNLTVAGNVTTVSANNLILQDNMIYLNNGNKVANPDLGIAGNYNDGTYHHAGFFRDASDGIWKVYDNYKPEPDASPYIDTSNSTFRIASFQSNTLILTANPGTAPLSVSSTTLVNNLNSDYLDGQHGTYYSPLTFVQQAFDAANAAFGAAYSALQGWKTNTLIASNSTGYISNTNINYYSSNNTLSTTGILSSANVIAGGLDVINYVNSSNTQLKSYTDGAIALANTQLKAYVDGSVSSGNVTPININSTSIDIPTTLLTNRNGLSVGPISIVPGITVTITGGQKWLILGVD